MSCWAKLFFRLKNTVKLAFNELPFYEIFCLIEYFLVSLYNVSDVSVEQINYSITNLFIFNTVPIPTFYNIPCFFLCFSNRRRAVKRCFADETNKYVQ